jgi:hypothetical protein
MLRQARVTLQVVTGSKPQHEVASQAMTGGIDRPSTYPTRPATFNRKATDSASDTVSNSESGAIKLITQHEI